MRYFPAFFDLKDRPVFVVGDDELAVRKLRLLIDSGADLWVFSAAEQSLVANEFAGKVTLFARDLSEADLFVRPSLGVIATEDEKISTEALGLLKKAHVPVNIVDQPADCDVVIPSIVSRGDMSIGISTGGAAPVVGRRLRATLESLLPQRLGDLISFTRARRQQIAEVIAPDNRRAFYERLLAGPAADAVLEGDAATAENEFKSALAAPEDQPGSIHLVGAGPGDPELLTLKALRVLQEADVILYDSLVSDAVLTLARRDAERHFVGKRRANHSLPQEEIGAWMISLAKEGKRVARLKGGDPFIFGRGGEELEQVRAAGLDAVVVPGITAATGCAASASVPLTHRGISQAVSFVTAYAGEGGTPDIDWAALAQLKHTVVVYMGVSRARDVAEALIKGGRGAQTPAAIIEKGTTDEQKIVRTTLDDLPNDIHAAAVKGPALLVIGEVAATASGAGLIDLTQTAELAA